MLVLNAVNLEEQSDESNHHGLTTLKRMRRKS